VDAAPDPVPDSVRRLAEDRARARADRDFAAADCFREQIAAAGWVVRDVPDGFALEPQPLFPVLETLAALPDRSAVADTHLATVSVLVEGWPTDVRACLDGLRAHIPADVRLQLLDLASTDGAGAVAAAYASPDVEVWHLRRSTGWAEARTALLRADTARIHIWCEASTVLTGDAITTLLAAFDDPTVVGAGWRGVNVDADDAWRSFTDAGPGEVDAILGYLFAMRRAAALAVGGPDAKARFYRNADMEFSFALREHGLRAQGTGRLVVPAGPFPLIQGRHHGYHDSDPGYRDRESARTYQRFLARYRGRTDLLAPRTLDKPSE